MKKLLTTLIIILAIPAALQSREFLNTVVHLNFGGMYGLMSGNVIDSENSSISSTIPSNTNISHYETAWCATLDIVPVNPIILGMESHAVKFGLRSSYSLHYIEQRVTDNVEIGDKLMDYRQWMIGPVIHYAPSIEPSDINEDYTSNAGFTFFALYGRLNGDLTAYPAIREKGESIPTADYNTKISGYRINIGAGAEVAVCSLNVGVNIYYSYINLSLRDKIYNDLGRNGIIKEGCMEIYVGIPIESFIKPLIPKF